LAGAAVGEVRRRRRAPNPRTAGPFYRKASPTAWAGPAASLVLYPRGPQVRVRASGNRELEARRPGCSSRAGRRESTSRGPGRPGQGRGGARFQGGAGPAPTSLRAERDRMTFARLVLADPPKVAVGAGARGSSAGGATQCQYGSPHVRTAPGPGNSGAGELTAFPDDFQKRLHVPGETEVASVGSGTAGAPRRDTFGQRQVVAISAGQCSGRRWGRVLSGSALDQPASEGKP